MIASSPLAAHIHLDPIGGIAGDMFVAALLDTFPQLEARLLALVASLNAPVRFTVEVQARHDHALRGKGYAVSADDGTPPHRHAHAHAQAHTHGDPHEHAHPHAHDDTTRYARHGHTPLSAIVAWLEETALTAPVRAHAIGIFRVLAEAEGSVHGVPVEQVEFHEVGAWDSIADIVSAAFLVDAIGAASWSIAPLPIGGGIVNSAHGALPVPAPATAWLTRGMAVRDDGIPGERVTPTGAALLRYLQAGPRRTTMPAAPMVLAATGLGLGTRRLPDRANALRCLAFVAEESTAAISPDDEVNCIAFEIDDQSSEDLAVGLDRLRSQAGVLQVMQLPAFGKKGRMVVKVEVVATIEHTDDVIDRCFAETTTIGLRITRTQRRVLARTIVAPTEDGLVSAKVVGRRAGRTAKAEMDEIASRASGHAEREDLRIRSEAHALQRHEESHGND